jgi:hypothetical protein
LLTPARGVLLENQSGFPKLKETSSTFSKNLTTILEPVNKLYAKKTPPPSPPRTNSTVPGSQVVIDAPPLVNNRYLKPITQSLTLVAPQPVKKPQPPSVLPKPSKTTKTPVNTGVKSGHVQNIARQLSMRRFKPRP